MFSVRRRADEGCGKGIPKAQRLRPSCNLHGRRMAVIQEGPAVLAGPGALLFVHHVLVAVGIQQVGELARVVQLDAEQPAGAIGVGVDQLGLPSSLR